MTRGSISAALTVLKARMNQDLRMADKLKATGAGNFSSCSANPTS